MLRTLLLAALVVAAPALAYQLRTDSQGDVVRWAGRVEFVLDKHFEQQLHVPNAAAAVAAAVAVLRARTPALEVVLLPGAVDGEVGYAREADAKNENTILVLEDWPYESTNLATTIITLNARTNLLLDADIAFNGESHQFLVVAEPVPGEERYDVQNTVTHELGHALGLMHNPEDDAAVMFPSAAPGEITKRTLSEDDISGLGELYDTPLPVSAPQAAPPPQVGCAAAPGAPPVALALAVVLFALQRRRARSGLPVGSASRAGLVSVAVAVASSLAQAAEPGRPSAGTVDEIAWGEVTEAKPRWLSGGKIIVTDVEVEVRQCVKGTCQDNSVRLQILGGRVGDIEQVVAHQPKVERGSQVVLTRRNGRLRLIPAH